MSGMESESMNPNLFKRLLHFKLAGTILWILVLAFALSQVNIPRALAQNAMTAGRKIFIPVAAREYNSFRNNNPMLLGVYPKSWLGDQTAIDNEIKGLDNQTGLKHTLVGTFTDIVEQNYQAAINMQFDNLTKSGYTPFINLMTTHSAYELASGALDGSIIQWAQAFKTWTNNGSRMAFIAPMPEMNGDWTPYGMDPSNFKLAFAHLQKVFADVGVARSSVRWVFAPNGASNPDDNFEYYYPGDNLVDALGFSAYNYGTCKYGSHQFAWKSMDEIASPFIQRMRAMAPSKPVFLTQVATSARTSAGFDTAAKDQWFREGYALLANTAGVEGVLYYNRDDYDSSGNLICDLALYRTWSSSLPKFYIGYNDAAHSYGYEYLTPDQLKALNLTVR